MNKVQVENITEDRFNPFNATPGELIASALHDAGLMNDNTLIDGELGNEELESYFSKRTLFRDATRLGKMLIEDGKIPHDKLKEALNYQEKSKGKKLGEILVTLGVCSASDINRCLHIQRSKRGEDAL